MAQDGSERGHERHHVAGQLGYLVGVANDGHSRVAARFAGLRARNTGSKVTLIHVMPPPEFQHWDAVGELMRAETREASEALLGELANEVEAIAGSRPATVVREGRIGEEILKYLEADPSITVLVVGAAQPDSRHGTLISWLASQLAGQLHIPLVIVPGNLSDQALEDLT
jgi:nucleotide-binding universal stress UspA family protein